jgi:microcystin degradation protein MlrC
MKILVAGFKHETNTFAPDRADWSAFEKGEMFPAAIHGEPMLELMAMANLPVTGFLRVAAAKGWQIVPGFWCGAVPSSYITGDAFERVCDSILQDVRNGGFDAIYLDLHGAAMAETADDAEGELLRRVRAVVGEDLPIVASLDLHANVTHAMLDLADGLVSYRTYPHIDYVETGELAAELLDRRLQRGRREVLSRSRLPYLIPLNAQVTTSEPAKSIFDKLVRLDAEYDTMLSFCMAFPAADFEECAPMIWGYGDKSVLAVEQLAKDAGEPSQWRQEFFLPREAVAHALERTAASGKPAIIADTQDNPGGGSSGNTTGMLHALLAEGAGKKYPGRVAFGMLFDKQSAAAAVAAGAGATVQLKLGTAVSTFSGMSDPPVEGLFKVRTVGDGKVTFKGPKMTGFVTSLGPSACLEIDGVLIAVVSAKTGTQDRELFRALGIPPEEMRIIVLKSSNHFRADFERIVADPVADILTAKAAGSMAVDPGDLPWKKLSPSIRTRP